MDVEAVKKYYNIPEVKIYTPTSICELLDVGEAIESRNYIYVRTHDDVVVHLKSNYIAPLVEETEKRVSEISSICGYMHLLPTQKRALDRVITDMYITMSSCPETLIFPIFATYDYSNSPDNNDDREEVAAIKTLSTWWNSGCRTLHGCIPGQAKYVYSYFAKLMLGCYDCNRY